jgi:hypothetical protein
LCYPNLTIPKLCAAPKRSPREGKTARRQQRYRRCTLHSTGHAREGRRRSNAAPPRSLRGNVLRSRWSGADPLRQSNRQGRARRRNRRTPKLTHAFSAAQGRGADLLIVIAPGVERFEYFRKLTRIAQGKERPESLREVQDLYDTYFSDSPEWEEARKK